MRVCFAIVLFSLLFPGEKDILEAADNPEQQPRVNTPHGAYLGSVRKVAANNHTYYAFTGIPYAKPPVGPLRFKAPEPLSSHPPVFNATSIPPLCLQWDFLLGRGMMGSEDCLYLNVYSNRIPDPPDYMNTQPILVFLHAGTWMSGGAAMDIFAPDYMMNACIMFITLNHRLGPFGFLSTGNEDAPGNYGLLDQILALEWIRDNSRYFGGMNETVTVMGSGAGGISSHFLTLTPKARGTELEVNNFALINKAISHSGTAYSPHAFNRDYLHFATRLAIQVGCETGSSKSIVSCLRDTTGEKIINAIPSLHAWDEDPQPFGPVLDKEWMRVEAYFPDEPHHLIKHQQMLKVPWIVGTNKNDGAFRVQDILKDPTLVAQLNQKWEKYGPILLHLTKDSCKDPIDIANQIRNFYLGKSKFGVNSEAKFIEMMTDRFFLYPTEKAAKEHCFKFRKERQYCYRYEHHHCSETTFLDILRKVNPNQMYSLENSFLNHPKFQNVRDAQGYGMSFLDELMYFFPSPNGTHLTDKVISRLGDCMRLLWTNFVKGGDPTPVLEALPDDFSPWDTWWEPYMPYDYYYLLIDPTLESRDTPIKESAMAFWAGLPLFENTDRNVIRDEL